MMARPPQPRLRPVSALTGVAAAGCLMSVAELAPDAGTTGGPGDGCAPLTCTLLRKTCGSVADGCGGTIDCGRCAGPTTCGGGGVPNECGCTATTCQGAGAQCGAIPDGCGGELNCGTCAPPLLCGAGGAANACGLPTWRKVFLPTTGPLAGVWGSAPDDVWAVGKSGTTAATLHWDGSAWKTVPAAGASGGLRGVWGSARNDVWAVGDDGTILHWTGAAWSRASGIPRVWLTAVWGSGPTNVWAVGYGGNMLRWHGAAWSSVTSPATNGLFAIWGSSENDVWAAGEAQTVLRWNGATWSAVAWNRPVSPVLALWGAGARDVFAGGIGGVVRWGGTTWSAVTISGNFFALCGSSATDVWAFARGGPIWHFDGSEWSNTFNTTFPDQVLAASSISATDVWGVGVGYESNTGVAYHYGP